MTPKNSNLTLANLNPVLINWWPIKWKCGIYFLAVDGAWFIWLQFFGLSYCNKSDKHSDILYKKLGEAK